MSDEVSDVPVQDVDEGRVRPIPVGEPVWKLLVPDQVMAADQLTVSFGYVEDSISSGVIEDARFGLGVLPLMTMSGFEVHSAFLRRHHVLSCNSLGWFDRSCLCC